MYGISLNVKTETIFNFHFRQQDKASKKKETILETAMQATHPLSQDNEPTSPANEVMHLNLYS